MLGDVRTRTIRGVKCTGGRKAGVRREPSMERLRGDNKRFHLGHLCIHHVDVGIGLRLREGDESRLLGLAEARRVKTRDALGERGTYHGCGGIVVVVVKFSFDGHGGQGQVHKVYGR